MLIGIVSVTGCGTYFVPHQQKAKELAESAGWTYGIIAAPPFSMAMAISPGRGEGSTLTVYLEGDGLAFVGSSTVSSDPTPNDPVALRMALAHPGKTVAYLARPCQYGMTDACGPAYWTSHRYAPAIIDAVGRGIDILKQRTGAKRLILVGYSGGGAVAALLAARRSDVAGIVTAAANLDVGYWARSEGLSPLSGSLDPADQSAAIAGLRQVHFVGGADDVVPSGVVTSFIGRLGPGHQAELILEPKFRHGCCWAEEWPRLARSPALSAIPGWRPERGP